ncbi:MULTISPECIES: molecular chaperone DnaJ [Prochlorococcus]|uniref:Chaperone protein DnaJ n=1 Tax=Prochlorococcus marinus (strain SARG / CCMP1375 / SS120) TaxID=167539 RepID=DNAJ_PROMA|nr:MULTISPECIES: molecular chaperone DnaJ [Prochlorococcus]Q7VEJ6.1 RecName: Full=Chaperone protein DnaJ [Prochlorococcus marinus subsp. marinus str. CCMP1375]AAP99063.1 DnaJ-class molecular chaperone [Prochlorococcus marinus subsp. marinus str. CCMP1375]KGG11681.1 Chaperone protein DnaJ [Prochlorococcus marinus str. LG]KGG22311.1 Chaperone protein DnaJ [Prochlorococcus marinus str. SS2]KGG22648.1 Chaperone protein DnaJ [Prochlorococcus marinus str. SS35]KGG32931.1 Chaperone protein DnaJ [Pro
MADFYDTLGVNRNADADSLKRAYRRLARQYHPDINKEAGAEERFKEIGRAYEVLGDPEKRARYDQFGEAGLGGSAGMPDMGDMGGFADIFETFFSGFGGPGSSGARTQRRGPQQGDDLRYDLTIDFNQAVFGQEREIKIPHLETCDVCRGTGAKPGTGPTTCSTCGGAGQVRRATRTPFGSFTQVSDCPTCSGSGQVISDSCQSCGGQGVKQVRKKLRINIPAGVDTGTRLRVSGEGNAGPRGGPSGDLYVFLKVKSHARLKRDGLNIHSEVNVSYLQAILGDTIEVDTVDGPTTLQIPSGTQPSAVLILDNKGIPKLGNPVARGNHCISVNIKIPSRLTDDEKILLEKLAIYYSAKGPQNHHHNSGLFSRLFKSNAS